MPRKQLRPYQVRLIADVCRAGDCVLVEQPTGSGKTMQIVTLVAMQLGQRFTHAVIAAPQQQVEHAFVNPDYGRIAFPTCQGVAAPDIEVPEGLILGARNSKQVNSASRLIAYLRHGGPQDYALACTHAALNRLTPERLPDDLSGKALFLDEAHHASADGLSEIVSFWSERGGQHYFFTATPYRGDGRPVALDGMRLYRRSLAEHMAEGFAPRHLESEIVALGHRGERITAAQFTGEEAPPPHYFDELIAAVCRRWMEDGRPKAIVRVPPMRGGSGGLVSRLSRAFDSHGARVLDATGASTEDKKRFLNALDAEKMRSHAEAQYDVIVGIQRGLPGGSSLALLLAEHRDARNRTNLPNHTEKKILIWVNCHFKRTGKWPSVISGPVVDAPGEKWANIDAALTKGLRGLSGGLSLAQLIKMHCKGSV